MLTISERDQSKIWHPFTQHLTANLPKTIVRGEGAYIFDEEGHRYLDLVSSWWVNLHGHANPIIAKAIYDQALTLEHVIFAGFTHEPAVQLSEKILDLLPTAFSKVFFSDNGSTAIEVALKMAYQYWRNCGQPERRRFIAFEKSYHGDTFGAMSVGKASHFFTQFEDLFFPVDFFPYPETWLNDETILVKEKAVLDNIKDYLEQYPNEVAALIIEPLVQGAGGMRMCRLEFLSALEKLVKDFKVLIIYDEVMTGFGRTGDYFACLKAKTTPDIICLAKGLTGGFLPLAVTVCQENIYQAFLGEKFDKALTHGHSFTANPLGCAAALASMTLLTSKETQKQIQLIEAIHAKELTRLATLKNIEKVRYCGTIAAFDLKTDLEYGSSASLAWPKRFMKKGLLIRPLGNVIYFLPPYCIVKEELQCAYQILIEEIKGVLHA